ncbi:hypothetical protein GCM10011487_11300 [Steroidobacter agaridevorans]|uniref:Sporadically distributed protein, TIGR04141 family n=1 Tax=Steroidobacter agaridevorans TaxID=2695856 RepID=A0A829Y7D5_9GAMM|nr:MULTISPECIES: TIGR04141 family sporadically distributed protein [Steroidobacteraceae]GFE79130.1 hypothetical protein GCM10011487_11300 [Steroidobacter agaridevorans]
MSKSRSFSIYLLKEGFDASNALKDNHKLDAEVVGENLPEGSSLYILDTPPTAPWWKGYFGIQEPLTQSLKGAIIFLPVANRTFAITFGHVYHNFHEASYEYDFGLRVTLNCLDPEKLKSTDILEPSGAKRQRTQVPIDSDLTFFDFDRDTTILKSLTGKVRAEYKGLFGHATGASNIRISSDVTPEGLPGLCEQLLDLYSSETYKVNFPDIQNISPVRDPGTIALLNVRLLDAVKAKSFDLALSAPKILDYHDELWATFSGAGSGLVYDDIFIGRYYEYLEICEVDFNAIDNDTLKNHCLVLTNEDGEARGERYSIYKCLVFDTTLNSAKQTYHLCEGNWYLVENDFVTRLSTYLDPLCAATTLPNFNHEDEGEFNKAVAATGTAILCLDKTSIAPAGQKAVEPCDLYELKNGQAILHHVKISTLSAQLSHLFNQGTNSIHLLRDDDESRKRLTGLVEEKAPAGNVADFTAPIAADNFKIVFGVVTHKNPAAKSANLPLFSRISLMRAMKDMKRMGIDAELCFIKDDSVTTAGKVKKRKPRAKKQADDGIEEAEAA